jgi:hypothetical protein
MRHAAWEATKGAFRKAGLLGVVFTITLDIAEWHADYEKIDPKTGKRTKDFFDLFAKVGMDLAYAGMGAALAVAVMAAVLAVTGLVGIAVGGAFVVIGTVLASIYIGYKLAENDKDHDITNKLSNNLREIISYLSEKLPNDYGGYGNAVHGELVLVKQ